MLCIGQVRLVFKCLCLATFIAFFSQAGQQGLHSFTMKLMKAIQFKILSHFKSIASYLLCMMLVKILGEALRFSHLETAIGHVASHFFVDLTCVQQAR